MWIACISLLLLFPPLLQRDIPRAKVLLLGTYHMDSPGRDLVKTKIRDTFSPERQAEILKVVAMLRKFKPNRIALETLDDRPINERYGHYLAEAYQLSRDEREQIGFRLAREAGVMHLDAIDAKLDMDFDKPMAMLGLRDKPRLDAIVAKMVSVGPLLEEIDARYTVGQILALNNSDQFIDFGQRFYMSFLAANDDVSFPGADMLGDWYKRNLRIFARLESVVQPEDRVFVMFGSGHVKYLRDIIRDSSTCEYVSPLGYLPPPPDFKVPGD